MVVDAVVKDAERDAFGQADAVHGATSFIQIKRKEYHIEFERFGY